MSERVEALLAEMTLEEKVSLLAGASMWYTVPVERLDIPAIKVTDGPNGARGDGELIGGVHAACFPVGIALAATWNTDLINQVGVALGEEARTKGAHFLLAPTVNIHRSPLNGRNFECFSEDPYLTARLAVAYITGLQSQNVGATIKHFVCNESEFERMTISSEVGERALRELYLPPFKAAVKEAGTWAVMSSYNKINGTYACDNTTLLTDILRGEWGFDGIVMSDWTGTKSTAESVNAGQDLEMPGPAVWRGEALVKAVEAGQVSEETITERARNMLHTIERVGAFENPEIPAEQGINNPAHQALIRRTGAEAAVLLKNENQTLPIDLNQVKSVALIGPNAKTARVMGAGSSQVNAHYVISPYDGIVNRVGDAALVGYALGCTNHKALPTLDMAALSGGAGFAISYYNSLDCSGDVVGEAVSKGEHFWMGEFVEGINPNKFSACLTTTFTAGDAGTYQFSLISAGLSRLFLDDALLTDNWTAQEPGEAFFGMGSKEVLAAVELTAGQTCDLRVEYARSDAMIGGLRVGCLPPIPADALDQAAQLAAASDVALVFVGLHGEWESEGFDRPDMELIGEQVTLIERVAAANPNTIVVLQTGSPITMPWLDKVPAVVQAWFPGQECGNAMADVLFGDVSPSGRLPQTFPLRLEDNPAFINYPGENGKVTYGEGIFVGYRYYEKKQIAPLFPFGYGLSYTTFAYDNLRLSASELDPADTLTVTVDITNTGDRAGQEVVQLYVRDSQSTLARPEKELKGFAKVALEPGETRPVSLTLGRDQLAYYDDLRQEWVAEAGEFEVLVGGSSHQMQAAATFTLTATVGFDGPEKAPPVVQLTLESPLADLLAHEGARAMLEQAMPGMLDNPQMSMAMGMSLKQIAGFAPEVFTDEVLAMLAGALANL